MNRVTIYLSEHGVTIFVVSAQGYKFVCQCIKL